MTPRASRCSASCTAPRRARAGGCNPTHPGCNPTRPTLQPYASQARYLSLLPSARTVIGSYLGHHWRVRTAAPAAAPAAKAAGAGATGEAGRQGRLLLDLYPHVIPVHSCGCEPFARDPTHYTPPAEAASFGLNASALVFESHLPYRATVLMWDGSREVELGALHPPRSPARGAAHLVLEAVWPGTLLLVRRRRDAALVLQHLVGDIVVRDCASGAAGGTGASTGSARQAAGGAAGVGGGVKGERLRLQKQRATAQREADELRAQLSLLKGIDVQGLLQSAQASTPEMLDELVRNATAALVALQPPKARTGGTQVAPKAGAPSPSVRPVRTQRRHVEDPPGSSSNLGAPAIGSLPVAMRDEL